MAVEPEHYFILKNGAVLKDVFELGKALEIMPEDVFRHHVNDSRNDFYNWILTSIKDKELAEKVKTVKDIRQMRKVIGDKIQQEVLKTINKINGKTPEKNQEEKKPEDIAKRVKELREVKEITLDKKPILVKKEELARSKPKIKKQLIEMFEKEFPTKKMTDKEKNYGMGCPHKTFHCGTLEFIFGILIGLLIALAVAKMI